MLDKRLRSMLFYAFKSQKVMNAKRGNYIISYKQINYSMHQPVKLEQPKRKATIIYLKTASYLGAKLWNDNSVLCNELWNEDFLPLNALFN